jgi:hypothetical protein
VAASAQSLTDGERHRYHQGKFSYHMFHFGFIFLLAGFGSLVLGLPGMRKWHETSVDQTGF